MGQQNDLPLMSERTVWKGAASHFEILLNLVYRTTGEDRLKGAIKD
jgi:hypothetical protein